MKIKKIWCNKQEFEWYWGDKKHCYQMFFIWSLYTLSVYLSACILGWNIPFIISTSLSLTMVIYYWIITPKAPKKKHIIISSIPEWAEDPMAIHTHIDVAGEEFRIEWEKRTVTT